MTMISTLRVGALAAAVLCLGSPAPAQTSLGFEDPGDTATLLAYRLPDWGWRTWDATFDLGGGGGDRYGGDDERSVGNRFNTRLGTDFDLYRESERRDWRASVLAGGSYQRRHDGSSTAERSSRSLNTFLFLSGNLREYLGGGPFFVRAGGGWDHRYNESTVEIRRPAGVPESSRYDRAQDLSGSVGIGLGRVRDVTPLVRAQRLGERLVAMGRPALTGDQVLAVARVLATEEGYRTVFDRPDRSFWRDTLEPLLDPDAPLSPYEIFYLRDVMNEDIGPRTQGAWIQVVAGYDEFRSSSGSRESVVPRRSVGLEASWDHNPTLNHQLQVGGRLNYVSVRGGDRRDASLFGGFQVAHLWTIADRYRWDNTLAFLSQYTDAETPVDDVVGRDYVTTLGSEFRIFVEDRMAILASVRGENRQEYAELIEPSNLERYRRRWGWSYGIGLEYRLDGFLH